MRTFNLGKATGNYLFTLLLIFGLATLMGFYFLIYVPGHEEMIHERNFRELNQISKNLNTRASSLITNSKNVISNDSAVADIAFALTRLDTTQNKALIYNRLKDQLNREVAKFNPNITFTELEFRYDALDHKRIEDSEIEIHTNTPRSSTILYSDRLDLSKKVKCILLECGNDPTVTMNEIHGCVDCVNKHGTVRACHNGHKATFLEYRIEIEADNLLESLLQYNQFEHFILTTKDWVIYESHPSGSLVFEEALDSLMNQSNQIQTTNLKQLKVNGKDYETYIRPIFVSKKQHWNLVGFVDANKIREEKLSISPKLSLILFLVSILVILLLPVIKLRFINNQEKLDTKDIILAYFSILCLVVLSTVLALTFFHYNRLQNIELNRMTHLTEGINNAFVSELDSINQFLLAFEDSYADLNDEAFSPLRNSDNVIAAEHASHFKKYPYLEDFFVLEESGMQQKKWTIKRYRTPKFNVQSRNYFSKIKNGAGMALPVSTASADPYYVQSIVSYNTGQQLTIVTKQPSGKGEIIGLTTRLYSMYSTVLPYGYQFAVIDADGQVQFHSDSEKNLQENFYDEITDSEKTRNLIATGNYIPFITEYYGERSTVYISKLMDGHYLVVIGNKEILYGLFSRVLRDSITIPFTIIIFLFIGIWIHAWRRIAPISYSSIFRPSTTQEHIYHIAGTEVNRNTLIWLLLVLVVSMILPALVFHTSLNREQQTLELLIKHEARDAISEKQNVSNRYVINLTQRLSGKQKEYLIQNHNEKRSQAGIFLPGLSDVPEEQYIGLFSAINLVLPMNDFDYLMNNTFQARASIISKLKNSKIGQHIDTESATAIRKLSWSFWFSLLLLLIYLLLSLYIAKLIFSFAVSRFFKARIDSPGNWLYDRNEPHSDKVFIVSLKLISRLGGKKGIKWQEFFEQYKDTISFGKEVFIVNFPHTVAEFSEDEVLLFHRVSVSETKVTICCKQTPLLLVKEINDRQCDVDEELFVEALSMYDTFYIRMKAEDIADASQSALKARSLYQKILSVLTKNEQYLVYDLAEDGVINVRNHEMVNTLFKKGVLVPAGKLRDADGEVIEDEDISNLEVITDPQFFDDNLDPEKKLNLSFRNFVLDRFDNEFVESLREGMDQKSTWSRIRLPLFIVFIGLFIFIVFTQRAYLAQIIGILSSLLTVLGLLSKFSNTFSSAKTPVSPPNEN